MRLLTSYELDLVAGGTTSEDYITVHGPDPWDFPPDPPENDPNPDGGGAGGGQPSDPPPPPEPADRFDLKDVDCPKESANFNEAVKALEKASPTAAALLSEIQSEGWAIHLVNDGIDETHIAQMSIDWDPYSALEIKNAAGQVIGSQSAMVGLAHELAHASLWDKVGGSAEMAATMALENKIIDELNAYYGNTAEAHRAGHTDGKSFNAQSSTSHSATANNVRPSCG